MTLTSQRACLSLGVLVKALGKNGNDTEANAIMEKLHRWLYKQGDGKSICLCNYDLFTKDSKLLHTYRIDNYVQVYLQLLFLELYVRDSNSDRVDNQLHLYIPLNCINNKEAVAKHNNSTDENVNIL